MSDDRTRVAAAMFSRVGAFVAWALLVGFALPLHRGLALPLVVVAAAVALRMVRTPSATKTYEDAPRSARAILFVLTALPAAVLLTVGARAVAAVTIAYPAALWAVPVVVAAVALPRLRTAAVPIVVGLALLVPVAGVVGTRFEADGEQARGWMHSGPIHGIHPGQTTAVVIDGFGPFDLPVNDYVEPAGGRGYDPESFAAMIEEALHRIAEVHFADGPARARMAFAEAEAQAVVTEPVRERLGRDPDVDEHNRFLVRSGTFGQRSRVEFVCPGRRDDPRGHPGDNVMNRMCPTKYASEASAGLGVTGRWPGYAEFRGNERLGLSRALGWTRSDDERGREVLTTEQRIVAWLVVALVIGLVAFPRLRAVAGSSRAERAGGLVAGSSRAERAGGLVDGMSMLAGAVGVGALVLVLVLVIGGEGAGVHVGIVDSAHRGGIDGSVAAWLPALLLVGGIPAFGSDTTDAQQRGAHWGTRIAAAMVAVTVLLLASNLAGLELAVPRLYGEVDGELALQQWVAAAADAMGERYGLGILEVEGAIASAIVAGLLGGLAHAVRGVAASARGLAPAGSQRRFAALALLGLFACAAAVIVSRKTLGGAALVPGAIGLTLVLHGGLQVLRSLRPCRADGAPRPSGVGGATGRRASLLLLPVWVGLALVCLWHGVSALDPHPFVFLCTLVGGVAALGGLVLPVLAKSRPGA